MNSKESEKLILQIKENIKTELGLIRSLDIYSSNFNAEANPQRKELLQRTIDSLAKNIKTLNSAIPDLIKEISITKKLPSDKESKPVSKRISFIQDPKLGGIAIPSKQRGKFLKDLKIQEELMKRVRKESAPSGKKKKKSEEFRAARGYLKLSNKFFLDFSRKIADKGYFRNVEVDLKKSNLDILFQTYISMIFFTVLLSIFASLFIIVFLIFFEFSFSAMTFNAFEGNYLIRLGKLSWILFAIPAGVFLLLYNYPSSEKGTLEKRVNQELPFAVIHMSAISGSGIEPSKIFQIICLSEEYPYLRKEIRKVINQINLYGYDLVTALNNASKTTPSPKLAELFAGLSTTISTGGDLTEFFEKRSETLMVSYRLEREQYSKIAETFMDIYISVVIATPMMLLLLLVMLQMSGISIGLSSQMLGFLIIAAIAVVNLVFLGIMHLKQPAY